MSPCTRVFRPIRESILVGLRFLRLPNIMLIE
jgi:hypothetical protein